MFCPTCNYQLQQLSVTTDSGGRFDVEHCGRCGGTWFDPYEINRIPYHEITRLAKMTVIPKKAPAEPIIHKCPRCHKNLEVYQGESVPANVNLFRCGKCHGIWATQRALLVFKDKQEDTIKEYKIAGMIFPSLSVVFLPAIFMILLAFSTYITITNLSKSHEERIFATEQIANLNVINISPTTVSVSFQTKNPFYSKISYGRSTLEMNDEIISDTLKTSHGLVLKNLIPDTSYVYKITLKNAQGSSFSDEIRGFKTKI